MLDSGGIMDVALYAAMLLLLVFVRRPPFIIRGA